MKGELSANGDAWNTCHFLKTGFIAGEMLGAGSYRTQDHQMISIYRT